MQNRINMISLLLALLIQIGSNWQIRYSKGTLTNIRYLYIYMIHLELAGPFCHKEPMSYDMYMEIMRESAVFLDDPYEGQTGLTTRVFDALQTDTKILTTNDSISHYPVYSPNIAILDRNHI